MIRILLFALTTLAALGLAPADEPKKAKIGKRPPVSVTYFVTTIDDAREKESFRAALAQVKSVVSADLDAAGQRVTVRFDSHVVSYHQIAQAIADAGTALGKKYAPHLKIRVPAYAEANNAAKVDALFAGKRLNQRVRIALVDKARGEFLLHFQPLALDPALSGPQGFNGGHLNHPVHDAPPRGLGLEFQYVSP